MEKLVAVVLVAVVIGAALLGTAFLGPPASTLTVTLITTQVSTQFQTTVSQTTTTEVQLVLCKGRAKCWQGIVTNVIDGDTLEVDSIQVRLALTDTPERGQPGGSQALEFTRRLCPIGGKVIVDQDDKQLTDRYGRVLAVVWCSGKNLNAELLNSGLAHIDTTFCSRSEFREEDWAKKYGCP